MYWLTGTDEVLAWRARPFSLQVVARQKEMSLLRVATMEIVRLLEDAGFARFEIDRVREDIRNCFLIVVSCSSDIPERNDRSSVNHFIAVTRPYVTILVTTDDIFDKQESDNRQLRQILLPMEECSAIMES